MNKQQLANKIWESANKMRSKIEANEYKDYILGFIFYKYLSDKQEMFLIKEEYRAEDMVSLTEDNERTVKYIQDSIGYFIAYENLFSTWLSIGNDFSVSNVHVALSAFSRLIDPKYKKVFDGIFDTLQTGLSKLGENSGSQTKSIRDLLYLIKDIPMDGRQDYDVLGFIYEYLIGMFAANAGKKAGEFYTPHEVSVLMSEIVANHLKDKKEIEIYDPTSGSGSLLINIGRSVAKHMESADNIKYYAQELKQNTYNLTRMNLVMRGILPSNILIRNGDTLEEDWPYFNETDPVGSYNPLYVDAVVSNPPYSQPWASDNKEVDPRYSRFGLAPKSKADYAFLLHDLYHIKPGGIMTIVLPHGVLFRGGEEGEIRKNLIEQNHIDAIIGLPANIFFGTGIPTIVMVLRQKRDNTDTFIVDASKGFVKVGKNNKLRASDIKKIIDAVVARKNIDKFSRKVERDEIRSNEYNLNIPRYIDSSDSAETWDIYASMFGGIPEKEIAELKDFWQAFPNLKDSLFEKTSSDYSKIKVENVKLAIKEHSDISKFILEFNKSFSDFETYLKKELLEDIEKINASQQEAILSENIFNRLKPISLIDKYHAYQLLDDEWTKIAVDLEIIQTEGFNSIKQVDPNMVIKKKNNIEQEVQDGWLGHILPFDLVQEKLLKNELDSLTNKENRLLEITSEYEAILDSLSEEEKDTSITNDDGNAFVNAEVLKKARELKLEQRKKVIFDAESFEAKVIKVGDLIEEEKELKKQIKIEAAELHLLTKKTIEELSDEEALELLSEKWITPLVDNINKLPGVVIGHLSNKIKALADKYETTLIEVEEDIQATQKTLSKMIDDLTGNDFDMQGLSKLQELLKGGLDE